MKKNLLEWVVFGVGMLLIGATVGYLTYDAITSRSGTPSIEVKLGAPIQKGTAFYVPAEVINNSTVTVERVAVEVKLTPSSGEEETAELTLQFLPRHSRRNGWVTFMSDPRDAQKLSARVKGFEEP